MEVCIILTSNGKASWLTIRTYLLFLENWKVARKEKKNGPPNVNKGWTDEVLAKITTNMRGAFDGVWAYKTTRIFRLEEGRRFVSASECQTMKWGDGIESFYVLVKKDTVCFESTSTTLRQRIDIDNLKTIMYILLLLLCTILPSPKIFCSVLFQENLLAYSIIPWYNALET